MTGTVNSRHEITVRVPVIDALGQPRDIVAIVDTGYTGDLTLPVAVIGALGMTWVNKAHIVLGDGQIVEINEYAVTIIWDGARRPIQVQAVEVSPLLGMRLLIGHDLRARIASGGDVEITAIP